MALFLGFYFGIMLMIILINTHWYFITKEKSYIYYAFFKLLMVLLILQATGVIPRTEYLFVFNLAITLVVMLVFSAEFLELKKRCKHLHLVVNLMIIGFILFLISVIYIAQNEVYELLDIPYSLLISPLILIGYFIYKNGFEPAKYYVLAWSLSLSFSFIDDLNKFSLIIFYPNIPFDLIGHIIESVVIYYAIFIKTSLLIKEKEEQSNILIHRERLASMGQMLENISHQWRQPLNRIAAFIINMKMAINDKHDKDEYLISMLDQSQLQLEYMSDTINDFTHFNKQDTDKETFFVSSVVNDVFAIIGQSLEKNKISFQVTSHHDFSIHAYPRELGQVLLNLIQNAQDALIKRKVTQPTIQVIIDKNKLRVQDNAGGIEEAIVKRIFEPYFTTKNKSSSLGLGLYMSRLILDKHFNADIKVETFNNYTSFTIDFYS